jgi:hypothetical protein
LLFLVVVIAELPPDAPVVGDVLGRWFGRRCSAGGEPSAGVEPGANHEHGVVVGLVAEGALSSDHVWQAFAVIAPLSVMVLGWAMSVFRKAVA